MDSSHQSVILRTIRGTMMHSRDGLSGSFRHTTNIPSRAMKSQHSDSVSRLGIGDFLRRSRPLLEVRMSTSQILALCLDIEPSISTGEWKYCPPRCYVVGVDALHHNRFLYLSDKGAYLALLFDTYHSVATSKV